MRENTSLFNVNDPEDRKALSAAELRAAERGYLIPGFDNPEPERRLLKESIIVKQFCSFVLSAALPFTLVCCFIGGIVAAVMFSKPDGGSSQSPFVPSQLADSSVCHALGYNDLSAYMQRISIQQRRAKTAFIVTNFIPILSSRALVDPPAAVTAVIVLHGAEGDAHNVFCESMVSRKRISWPALLQCVLLTFFVVECHPH
jgi:hypothetical protein